MQRRLLVIGFWLLFAIGALGTIATNLTTTSDISAFLPKAKSSQQQLLLQQLTQGATTRLLLLAIEGGEQNKLIDTNKQFARHLRTMEGIVSVGNGELQHASALLQWIMDYRYLLWAGTSDSLSAAGLRTALEARLLEIRSGISPVTARQITQDPALASLQILRSWAPQSRPLTAQGVWVNKDSTRSLMVIETRAAGYDVDAQAVVIDAIRQAFSVYSQAGLRLVISGPALFALDAKQRISADAQRYSLIAGIALLLLLAWAYRSLRHALLAGLPLMMAILIAVAGCSVIFDTLHGVTLAFGVTLLGVTLDYPIHFFSHLRNTMPGETMRKIWPTMRIGLVTTVLGYLAFTLTEFDGLLQLAVFSIIGLSAGALSTRYLLPALPVPLLALSYTGTGRFRSIKLPDYAPLLTLIGVAFIGVVAIAANKPWLEDRLVAMSVIPQQSLALDRALRDDLQVPEVSELLLVKGDSPEQILQTQEALTAHLDGWHRDGLLGGYNLISRYLPSLQTQRQRQNSMPEAIDVEQSIQQAVRGLPLRVSAFQPFIKDVEKTKSIKPIDYFAAIESPLQAHIDGLLFPHNGKWVGVVTLSKVDDSIALRKALAKSGVSNVEYVNLSQTSASMLGDYMQMAAWQLVWVAMIIAASLLLALRDWQRVLRVVLIGFLALSVDVFILHLCGVLFSVFHLVALLLVLGIGLDYALFFTRREFDTNTLHSLFICCVSTVVVFALLACSEVPVIRAIGITVSVGVLACFILGGIFSRSNNPLSSRLTE